MKKHCMVDLETLGTATNSVIVAIGAVTFNPNGIMDRFYVNVSIDSSLTHGLVVDGGALKFWLTEANEQNRKDLFAATPRGLRDALSCFTTFWNAQGCEWFWGHGANFDEPVLRFSYQSVYGNNFVPWPFRGVRDTRTLFSMLDKGFYAWAPPRSKDKHNALADAEYQAQCVIEAHQLLGKDMEQ